MTKNYRIKAVTEGDKTRYYPQYKFLGLFWVNMFGFDHYWDGSYLTLEESQRNLCNCLKKPIVEYFDVNCEETK